MKLRSYQQAAVDAAFDYLNKHGEPALVVLPTGAGKSLVCAEIVRRMWLESSHERPRALIIVPSKELLEQNYEKVVNCMDFGCTVGMYSAAVNRKDAGADVIVATIGSIAKKAHLLGNIKMVVIDECHLACNNGKGSYRTFLSDLSKYCKYHLVGMTATPFRGNGLMLTKGQKPLFASVCHKTEVTELIEQGFLSPLVSPEVGTQNLIDTDGVKIDSKTGDYNVGQLSNAVVDVLPSIVDQSIAAAQSRNKWIAFTPAVDAANQMADLYNARGITCAVVCGDTPKAERAQLIDDFRSGRLRCLVTVLALATGFDVPDIDCIIWARPTRSPVLYVQGAGRGLRIAPGKDNCLWLDYSDTTDRMGPLDQVRGKTKLRKVVPGFKDCPKCHAAVFSAARTCQYCGHEFPPPEPKQVDKIEASQAPILSNKPVPGQRYPVAFVRYTKHKSRAGNMTLKVRYELGDGAIKPVVDEYVCLESDGYARKKAMEWWEKHSGHPAPETVDEALRLVEWLIRPREVVVKNDGKFTKIAEEVF